MNFRKIEQTLVNLDVNLIKLVKLGKLNELR